MADLGKPVIASCSNVVLTHDIERPYPLLSYKPHEGNVNCVVWNHNILYLHDYQQEMIFQYEKFFKLDLVLASCGDDGRLVLSHSRQYENLIQFDDDIQNSSPLTSIQFTTDSTKLASGGSNGRVKIYDLKNKCIAKTYSNHFGGVTSVDWHSNDYIIASSSQVGDIFLYNIENDQQVATFSENNSVQQIKFSPFKTNQLASCCGDGRVSIWDVNSKQQVAVFQKHSSKVNAISFSPHNRVLATSASLDMTINFYDTNEKKVVKTLPCNQPLTSLAFYSDGHTIIAGTLYGNMIVYDLRKGSEEKLLLEGHTKNQPVNHISIIRNTDSKNKASTLTPQKSSATVNGPKETNYQMNPNNNQLQNLLPPSTNNLYLQNQTSRLNDTISSLKSKASDSLPPNPYKQSSNSVDGNYSDREVLQKQNSNINQIPNLQGKNSSSQFAQQIQPNQSQISKLNGQLSASPAPSAKQSQILTNNNNINNSSLNNPNLLSGKSSQIISNNQQFDIQNASTSNTLQRKMSSNVPDDEGKANTSLNKNYSSKHLYNQNQQTYSNSSTKQSQILQNQQSGTKLSSPVQEDYLEMKKSGLTNVQPYELPPKASTVIEKTNGRNMTQIQAPSPYDEFTEKQKSYIKNILEDHYMDIKFHFSEQFQNLHIEIIRQFQIQQNELTDLLGQYVNKNKALEEKMLQLQQENERLKKSTY